MDATDRCPELIHQGTRHISSGSARGVDPMQAIRLIGGKVLPALRGTE